MANPFFRNKVRDLVAHAINQARSAGNSSHMGTRGQVREIAAQELFSPFLTSEFLVGTGHITDAAGVESDQTDIVIYDPHILPPILHTPGGPSGHFPVEACFYAIEVKSRVTAAELREAMKYAENLLKLKYCSGRYTESGMEVPYNSFRVVPALFGFDTDLVSDGKDELQRYSECDPNWRTNPLLHAFCVAGVGYWHFRGPETGWYLRRPSPDYDEVVGFIAGIANTLTLLAPTRGTPRLGHYLLPAGQDAFEPVVVKTR